MPFEGDSMPVMPHMEIGLFDAKAQAKTEKLHGKNKDTRDVIDGVNGS